MKKIFLITAILVMMLVTQVGLQPQASRAQQQEQMVQMLFVQSAKDVTFEGGKMTLKGINPVTVMFSDRPQRIAGHLATEEMIPLWDEGKDSFLKDPPNATASVFTDGKLVEVVVVLKNPQLKGDDLTYDVRILEGTPPTKGGLCSLFIDVIGMPLTPVSYAGAARRCVRRW
jgi:hypothetical protein